jgi:acetyl-CoA C-acetyltransferase
VHVEAAPKGTAKIETYTVTFDRETPQRGIVFGRLENGSRFVANTPSDQSVLQDMITRDQLGRSGTLTSDGKRNVFTPA